MDLLTPDEIVDQLLLDYYRAFLEADGVTEPTMSTVLDAIPTGRKPRDDK
jgi:hypothetical protein